MNLADLSRVLAGLTFLSAASLVAQVSYVQVTPTVIQQRLDLYKGNDTTREAALVRLFSEAGCSTGSLSEQRVPGRKQPNVICVLPGTTQSMIVMGGHFDHIAEGQGIADNWSGASLLPSLFQSLAGSPRKHTFVFVGFSGEEEGLAGSAFYVKQLAKDQLASIEAMINLDTLGLGPTEVWVSQSDPMLVNRLVAIARSIKLPITGMNVNGVGRSDEESFIQKGVCTITVHSVTPETLHVLHSSSDNPTAIRFSDYYDTYRLLASYLAVLDTVDAPVSKGCKIKPL
ncbi:MAG TPA: M28 family peptidase [Acidobacteriaceae bacterium]|nr:M28 family peptidase [Acidobacteriaceae bacterium]